MQKQSLKKELNALNKLKMEIAKAQKKAAKAASKEQHGSKRPPVNHPHKGRNLVMDIHIDVSRARSDGRCGKNVEWAPCALVPTGGRTEVTPCCNFQSGRCGPADQCECPHCVDYQLINRLVKGIDQNTASRSYSSDAFGILDQNADLYLRWVVDKMSAHRLMDKIMRMVKTQTENLKMVLKNKEERGCTNENSKLNDTPGNIFLNKIGKLQAAEDFPGVFDLVIKHYLQMNVPVPCLDEEFDQLRNRVHKATGTIKKAAMKITDSQEGGKSRKTFPADFNLPDHFAAHESRRERKTNKIKQRLGIA